MSLLVWPVGGSIDLYCGTSDYSVYSLQAPAEI